MNKFEKIIFGSVFFLIFCVVAYFVTIEVYDYVYEKQIENIFGESTSQETVTDNVLISESRFSCISDEKNVSYVFVHGLGDNNPRAFDYHKTLIGNKNSMNYMYDPGLGLQELSDDFVLEFNEFAKAQNVNEIIILGQSAGGVVASQAASRLKFDGVIQLHTQASPINGYNIPEQFLSDQSGFSKDLALGIEPFETPGNNVYVYHHKTIDDVELESYCGAFSSFCNGLRIQDNNIDGALEYFYNESHKSIMHPVSKLIIDCHT